MRSYFERYRSWLAVSAVVLAALGAIAAVWLARPQPSTARVVLPTPRPSVAPTVLVHVAGEVLSPGVYRLPATARVADALAAAGGATADGDPQALNLAAQVEDGQKLTVPRRAPTPRPGAPAATPADRRLNLNVASAAELDTLPGVGPVTAQRILEWRERNGAFASVEQLKELKLVNASVFERIKDLVVVE